MCIISVGTILSKVIESFVYCINIEKLSADIHHEKPYRNYLRIIYGQELQRPYSKDGTGALTGRFEARGCANPL